MRLRSRPQPLTTTQRCLFQCPHRVGAALPKKTPYLCSDLPELTHHRSEPNPRQIDKNTTGLTSISTIVHAVHIQNTKLSSFYRCSDARSVARSSALKTSLTRMRYLKLLPPRLPQRSPDGVSTNGCRSSPNRHQSHAFPSSPLRYFAFRIDAWHLITLRACDSDRVERLV